VRGKTGHAFGAADNRMLIALQNDIKMRRRHSAVLAALRALKMAVIF
jgi:hypothetical protein